MSPSHHSLLAQGADVALAVARGAQYLVGMRAGLRRRQPDVPGQAAHVDRRGDHLDIAEVRAMHRRRHAEMAHLGIGEYLVDLIDRATGNTRALEQLDPMLRRLMPRDLADRGVDGGAVGAAALLV